ncbi:hypothetical protein Tco_1018087 [Tanacetum coccineum]|uniref:Uncharacterized protein n=1 Tax=Tanacetum coccineum TaxID=301880 RepID=A0ABQ5FVZ1_9ASTR
MSKDLGVLHYLRGADLGVLSGSWFSLFADLVVLGVAYLRGADLGILREIIVLCSNSSDFSKGVSSKGPSIASVPKEEPSIPRVPKEGPSIPRVPKEGPSQELLDWYEYETIEEYLKDIFFDSTDKDTTDKDSIDKDEDTIDESYSPKSKGKYVPVSQKHSLKVIFKSHIPITGCVLGLANVHTWDSIVKKFGVRKLESCADKANGKRKWVGGWVGGVVVVGLCAWSGVGCLGVGFVGGGGRKFMGKVGGFDRLEGLFRVIMKLRKKKKEGKEGGNNGNAKNALFTSS